MRKAWTVVESHELPDHFSDVEVCAVLCDEENQRHRKHPLTCGLLMKLRTAFIRITKRSVLNTEQRKKLSTDDRNLYKLVEAFTTEADFLHEHWPSTVLLYNVAVELATKAINLSPALQRELNTHPLGVPKHLPSLDGQRADLDAEPSRIIQCLADATPQRVSIHFNKDFLRRVKHYHEQTTRPDGTFDSPVKVNASPTKGAGRQDEDCGDVDECGVPDEPSDAAESSLLLALANLPKETCPQCRGRRQVYCGDCGGRRMALGDSVLPPRVALPFDVLLLLHWQETLHKCTGVHVGALCTEGAFQSANWRKDMVPTVRSYGQGSTIHGNPSSAPHNSDSVQIGSPASSKLDKPPPGLREDWKNLVETLDHTRDVLLFPCEDAVRAEEFPWHQLPVQPQRAVERRDTGNAAASREVSSAPLLRAEDVTITQETDKTQTTNPGTRWRLVVLEASWNYGKGMAQQLRQHRESVGLPPLRCVQLTDVTGQYWKFQTMGHAAVSTIEAIAYTAQAAGMSQSDVQTMLLLFKLQKYRVIQRIEGGGKVPRAVQVSGAGLGSWKELTDCLDEL